MTEQYIEMITAPEFVEVWDRMDWSIIPEMARLNPSETLRLYKNYGLSQADLWERLSKDWSLSKMHRYTTLVPSGIGWMISLEERGEDEQWIRGVHLTAYSAKECLTQALMYEHNYIWRDGKWEKN